MVHRTLVSGEPADEEWVRRFVAVLLHGLAAADASSHTAGGDPAHAAEDVRLTTDS